MYVEAKTLNKSLEGAWPFLGVGLLVLIVVTYSESEVLDFGHC